MKNEGKLLLCAFFTYLVLTDLIVSDFELWAVTVNQKHYYVLTECVYVNDNIV